jgi:YVTN family beta-propeller protein
MRRLAAALALIPLVACQQRARAPAPLPALAGEGEVRVYLQPFPVDAERLGISLEAISAMRADGTEVPLELLLPELSGAGATGQRLLATGRLSPGPHAGLALRIRRATLAGAAGVADLLAPEEPVRVEVPFTIEQGRALLVRLALRKGQAGAQEFQFAGAFSGVVLGPENSAIQLAGYAPTPALAGITVFARRSHEVSAILPTGRQPLGIALDERALRAYVALGGEDQIQVLDLVAGGELQRIPLRAGDEPREIALTPDGSLLVVVNSGSDSVAFVDTISGTVTGSVRTGEEPSALLLDRGGRRAYVLNRRSRSMTVLDLANRTVAATVPTDPEPLRAQLNRDGSRLYLIARGSPNLTVFSVPELTVVRTVYLGLGAAALKVDPRSDLVYVGRGDEGRIQVFDPVSALPVDSIAVPGPVSFLALDHVENALVAALGSRQQVAFVDVTRKRLVATIDVGAEPYVIVLLGERP